VKELSRGCSYRLLVGYMQSASTQEFIDRVREREVKQRLLARRQDISKALNQALKLQAAKAAAEPPRRLREVTGTVAGASQLLDCRRDGKPVCWQGGSLANLAKTAGRGHGKSETRTWETSKAGVKRGRPASSTLSSRFTLGQRPSDPGKMRKGGDGKASGALGGGWGGWCTSSAYPARSPVERT
jgi:hypothetical protein